ncbi:unnamed protein product, partial [Cyprideis torosa]
DERIPHFYSRLFDSLTILRDFLHADGEGLSDAELKTERFFATQRILEMQKTSTDELIEMYWAGRVKAQDEMTTSSLGTLSVRAYFNHNSLTVEIFQARNLIPLDPNGFSDPFVQVELIPRRVFPSANYKMQQTQVQKKTLHPDFNEVFEFPTNLHQCRDACSAILFTVMDHDVITANDFAGEAYMRLSNVPGVQKESRDTISNLRGLRAIDLPLMSFTDKEKESIIFKTLESRSLDKVAQEFVKKQKSRVAVPY